MEKSSVQAGLCLVEINTFLKLRRVHCQGVTQPPGSWDRQVCGVISPGPRKEATRAGSLSIQRQPAEAGLGAASSSLCMSPAGPWGGVALGQAATC